MVKSITKKHKAYVILQSSSFPENELKLENSFYEANISSTLKPGNDYTRKENINQSWSKS